MTALPLLVDIVALTETWPVLVVTALVSILIGVKIRKEIASRPEPHQPKAANGEGEWRGAIKEMMRQMRHGLSEDRSVFERMLTELQGIRTDIGGLRQDMADRDERHEAAAEVRASRILHKIESYFGSRD